MSRAQSNALLAAIFVCSACFDLSILGAGYPSAAAAPVRLILAQAAPESVEAIDQTWVEPFNATHPDIQVQVLPIGLGGKVETMIAGGEPPDLIIAPEAADLAELVPTGALVDLDPYMKAAGIKDESFYPGLVDAVRQTNPKRAAIGLPVGPWVTRAMVYNKKLLDANALAAPSGASTWEQLVAWSHKIATGAGDARIWGFHIPFDTWGLIEQWSFAEGFWPYSSTTKSLAAGHTDVYLRYLDFLHDAVFTDKLAYCIGCQINVDFPATFLKGKEAFVPEASDRIDDLLAKDAAGQVNFEWNLSPYPTWEASQGRSGPTQARTIAILNAEHADAAWQFIQYVLSYDAQARAVAVFGLSPWRSVSLVEAWLSKDPKRKQIRWQALGLQELAPYPSGYWIPAGRDVLRRYADDAISHMEQEGISAGQTLAAIREGGGALLRRMNP